MSSMAGEGGNPFCHQSVHPSKRFKFFFLSRPRVPGLSYMYIKIIFFSLTDYHCDYADMFGIFMSFFMYLLFIDVKKK